MQIVVILYCLGRMTRKNLYMFSTNAVFLLTVLIQGWLICGCGTYNYAELIGMTR
jgi:hypothetical protein